MAPFCECRISLRQLFAIRARVFCGTFLRIKNRFTAPFCNQGKKDLRQRNANTTQLYGNFLQFDETHFSAPFCKYKIALQQLFAIIAKTFEGTFLRIKNRFTAPFCNHSKKMAPFCKYRIALRQLFAIRSKKLRHLFANIQQIYGNFCNQS